MKKIHELPDSPKVLSTNVVEDGSGRWGWTDILGTNLWILCITLGKPCNRSCFKNVILSGIA